jgi:hypothetical protein
MSCRRSLPTSVMAAHNTESQSATLWILKFHEGQMKPKYKKCFPEAKRLLILVQKRPDTTFGEVKILTTQFDTKFLRYDLWQSDRTSFLYGKVKLSLCLTNWALRHEDVWGSGYINPYFLDLGTSWRQVVSFTPRPLYPLEKRPPVDIGCEIGWTPEPVWKTFFLLEEKINGTDFLSTLEI